MMKFQVYESLPLAGVAISCSGGLAALPLLDSKAALTIISFLRLCSELVADHDPWSGP